MTESAPTSSPAQGEPPDLSTLDGVLAEANNLIRMHDAADSGGGCFNPKASRKWDRRAHLYGGMVLKHLVAEIARLQSHRATPDTGRKAIDRYRYAVAWNSADSWDGCSDCRARLQWARSMDENAFLSNDELAAIGRKFLKQAGNSGPSSPRGERERALEEAAKAADRIAVGEHGWVIEGAWSDPAEPQYWAGSSLWMSDHMCAIRFAREHDAKQAANAMLDGMNIRVCEHVWTGVIRESVSSQNIREAVSATPDTRKREWLKNVLRDWRNASVDHLAPNFFEAELDTFAARALLSSPRGEREAVLEEAAKVCDEYANRMRVAAGKPHPVTKRENTIAMCKQDAGEWLAKLIRDLKSQSSL